MPAQHLSFQQYLIKTPTQGPPFQQKHCSSIIKRPAQHLPFQPSSLPAILNRNACTTSSLPFARSASGSAGRIHSIFNNNLASRTSTGRYTILRESSKTRSIFDTQQQPCEWRRWLHRSLRHTRQIQLGWKQEDTLRWPARRDNVIDDRRGGTLWLLNGRSEMGRKHWLNPLDTQGIWDPIDIPQRSWKWYQAKTRSTFDTQQAWERCEQKRWLDRYSVLKELP